MKSGLYIFNVLYLLELALKLRVVLNSILQVSARGREILSFFVRFTQNKERTGLSLLHLYLYNPGENA